MKQFRAGIVGCGNIFSHARRQRNQMRQRKLVAVCDIKEDRAIKCAKEFNCNYYTDYKDMIEKENLDVLHICFPIISTP